jgi:hypothetical protein
LTAGDTFDRMATAARTRPDDRQVERLLALIEPPRVAIDGRNLRVLIEDRGEPLGYELWFRPGTGQAGGPGWLEFAREPGGPVATRAVSACEVMALAADSGRGTDVADLTLWLAELFADTDTAGGRAVADRLRAEVAAACRGERVSLRPLQARILEAMVRGETLSAMCRRGGFTDRRGQPDTTWFERRAGLLPVRCNKTGKWRRARTASPELVARLARAVDLAPAELGV